MSLALKTIEARICIVATSIYDTRVLKTTLERLVDFDRLNAGMTRFSARAADMFGDPSGSATTESAEFAIWIALSKLNVSRCVRKALQHCISPPTSDARVLRRQCTAAPSIRTRRFARLHRYRRRRPDMSFPSVIWRRSRWSGRCRLWTGGEAASTAASQASVIGSPAVLRK